MFPDFRSVHLDSIDFSSRWNLHPWELYSISENLLSSLSGAGILHPPILLEKNDNRFETVCGFKRLIFAGSLVKSKEFPCVILRKGTDPAKILEVALTDQHLAHPLSLVEKARFIEISSRYLQHHTLFERYFDRLMLEKRPATITRMSEVLRQHPLLLSEIHQGFLQDKVVFELLKLPGDDRMALARLFRKLGLGDGKQRKFLPLLRDLALREKLSIAALLEDPAIRKILEHPEMNNPQKVQHLSTLLQNFLHPSSTNAEKDFSNRVNLLRLPENCTITHSPFFEKDEVTVSITFKDFSACQEWIPVLKRTLG